MNTTSEKKLPFYSLMTERVSVGLALSFAHKIIIIPENRTKQKTLENWNVQSSENCLVPEVQFHAFCGFFFLSIWGGPVSELVIRHSQGVAKTSVISGMDLAHR